MQTTKATLPVLVCVALLGACGLKGPLYLPDENPSSKPTIEQDPAATTDGIENRQDTENDKEQSPVPG